MARNSDGIGVTALLIILAVSFAWSMGAHYTGACMGMPYALGALSRRQALILMAPLAWLGAALASHAVEHTVADRLTIPNLGLPAEVVVVGLAFALTTIYTQLKVPTSTIQILVFCVVGVALGEHVGVHWLTIGLLAITWICAPLVACALGFLLTKGFGSGPGFKEPRGPGPGSVRAQSGLVSRVMSATGALGYALVAVGMGASFVMGSNDAANATGSLVATRTFSPLDAGIVGGAGLAFGVLTWGRPLLERIAFEIVKLDRAMATAAQAVQAVVVITAVSLGLFTSMNQALVGAMVGAGLARGRDTVSRKVLTGILRGWALGPTAGLACGFGLARVVVLLAGSGALR
ncbi:MAG: inorganic phosphate transporter [Solirubrobacteraceae bacterium]